MEGRRKNQVPVGRQLMGRLDHLARRHLSPRRTRNKSEAAGESNNNASANQYGMDSKKKDFERPSARLGAIAGEIGHPVDSEWFAAHMDDVDPLREFRAKFSYPKNKGLPVDREWTEEQGEAECVYLCGNSLGLKPKKADVYMQGALENWGKWGVYHHFNGFLGAANCDQPGKAITAELVGAKYEHEVSLQNGLSVNIHLLMLAFYRPTKKRYKIIIEKAAFPSDRYAMVSLLELKGLDPSDALVQLAPREGEETLRTEDILASIDGLGDSVAVVMLSGVQYYTGQRFEVEVITRAAQAKGCVVGWDLAHSIGNVPLNLHDWNVDFACWCTYKYLNSGAGGISGIFIHDKYTDNMPKHLMGWWSGKAETRMRMMEEVDPAVGADSFRLANPPPWLAALNMASLEIFHEAGMDRIGAKQFLLTGYLEHLLKLHFAHMIEIITPEDPAHRGSQLSIVFSVNVADAHKRMLKEGVVCDFRYPSVIRIAPAPLYNSFTDVWKFISILRESFK